MGNEKIKLSALQPNTGQVDGLPTNPRLIKGDKFKKLCDNIRKYPKFLEIRPIVIKSFDRAVIIAGNMRFEALKFIGYKEIPLTWIKTAEDFTPDELRAFTILDNVPFGENDWEILGNEWNEEELADWGMDIPVSFDDSDDNETEKEKDDNLNIKTQIIICPKCEHEFSLKEK